MDISYLSRLVGSIPALYAAIPNANLQLKYFGYTLMLKTEHLY